MFDEGVDDEDEELIDDELDASIELDDDDGWGQQSAEEEKQVE